VQPATITFLASAEVWHGQQTQGLPPTTPPPPLPVALSCAAAQTSYDDLIANATKLDQFKADVVAAVAAAAQLPTSAVSVLSLQRGSVVAEVQVMVPAAQATQQQLAAISSAITGSPDAMFGSGFKSAYRWVACLAQVQCARSGAVSCPGHQVACPGCSVMVHAACCTLTEGMLA